MTVNVCVVVAVLLFGSHSLPLVLLSIDVEVTVNFNVPDQSFGGISFKSFKSDCCRTQTPPPMYLPADISKPSGTPLITISEIFSEPSVSVTAVSIFSGIVSSSFTFASSTFKAGASATASTITWVTTLVVAVLVDGSNGLPVS